MLPKSGSSLPKKPPYSDLEIADVIGRALIEELGGSRRATKTVMKWAEVSDRAARSWISGESCPSCRHLILLAAKSPSVMLAVLRLAGHEDVQVAFDLAEIELELTRTVHRIHSLRKSTPI
ncbi:hypothetical protein LQ954_11145 [Sphingomonas sp. IC-11]|uniref:hypothetical protein n=1 Tax=Sphingomonas sp. IC-11 TaxID=2898528 RepID=UPI001E64C033|nr:hypothetical protein [Sphingomonas sp. IC-11]MCD2316704.1 hypothetical protein [Sphingomonas sp. IC-11]